MKAKKGLIVQKIDEDYYVIDSGEELPRFNGMVKLNETSHFIISKLIEQELDIDTLYRMFLDQYDVDVETLNKTIPPVIEQLKKINIIKD